MSSTCFRTPDTESYNNVNPLDISRRLLSARPEIISSV